MCLVFTHPMSQMSFWMILLSSQHVSSIKCVNFTINGKVKTFVIAIYELTSKAQIGYKVKNKQDHIATESSKISFKKFNKNRADIIFMSVQYQRLTNNN